MYQELIDAAYYSRESYLRGLVSGTGGNTSVRIGEEIYITPTGCTLGDVQPEDFVQVPLHGESEQRADGVKASKEEGLHRSVYLSRPDIMAVLHLHPVNTIAATLILEPDEEMPVYTPGFLDKYGRLIQIGVFMAGSIELLDAVTVAVSEVNSILLRNHGLITGAKTIKQAFLQAEEIEDNSKLHLLLKGRGALTEDDMVVLMAQKVKK